ncbi:MAG: hypothetical protein ACOCVN_01190 [bacterium]
MKNRYEDIIALNSNEILRVEGIFEESFEEKDGLLEYWFYRFRIEVVGNH